MNCITHTVELAEHSLLKKSWHVSSVVSFEAMFVVMLSCSSCNFESETFVEGYDVHRATFAVIVQNKKNNAVRIAKVREVNAGAELSDVEFDEALERSALEPNEVAIRTTIGQEEVLPMCCPRCGKSELKKMVRGIT